MNTPKTFVSLGNATQPFNRMVDYLNAVYSLLPQPILVQSGYTLIQEDNYCVKDFLNTSDYLYAITSAEVLIFHGGAGSVINAVRCGKKPIIIPRISRLNEQINDHQIKFGHAIYQQGYAYLAENVEELKAALVLVRSDGNLSIDKSSARMPDLILEVLSNYEISLK